MESRHDSEIAERILTTISPKQLVRYNFLISISFLSMVEALSMQVDICVRAFKMHLDACMQREKERASQQEQRTHSKWNVVAFCLNDSNHSNDVHTRTYTGI